MAGWHVKGLDHVGVRLGLPDNDYIAFSRLPWRIAKYDRKTPIIREGNLNQSCMLLLAGYANQDIILRSGARQILSVHLRGEFLNLQERVLTRSICNVGALTSATVASVRWGEINELAEDRPAVARALHDESAVDQAALQEWLASIGQTNAASRVARFICEIALRAERAGMPARSTIHIPMTQLDLADAFGLSSVHLNRILQRMRKDRLIHGSLAELRLLDWERLCKNGGFDTSSLSLLLRRPEKRSSQAA